MIYGNIATRQPSKEQASSRTKVDEEKYVNSNLPGQKTKHVDKRKDKGHISRLHDNQWMLHLTTWKHYEGTRSRGRLAKRRRDEVDEYYNDPT